MSGPLTYYVPEGSAGYEDARENLRDEFALHAPPVPDWFDVPMPMPCPGADSPQSAAKWKVQRAIARLTQWPWHYADLVLAERDVVKARREQR